MVQGGPGGLGKIPVRPTRILKNGTYKKLFGNYPGPGGPNTYFGNHNFSLRRLWWVAHGVGGTMRILKVKVLRKCGF